MTRAAPLPEDGSVVASAAVGPEPWAAVLPPESAPLVLASGSSEGWFGGRAVVAWSPASVAEGLTLREATGVLEHAFAADRPILGAVLLPYDGSATAALYTGGLVATSGGWREWGSANLGQVRGADLTRPPAIPSAAALAEDVRTDLDEDAFRQGVEAVAEAIHSGDVYVLNLTRRLTGRPSVDPAVAFATLLARTAAPMAASWTMPSTTIVSASPERFLRVMGDRVEICPMKGTRPRGPGAADGAMAAALAASEKERAEHVMIVDLERNDLGRVCVPGSVTVDPLFDVVATPYCHQMVSTVAGTLRAGSSLADLLEAAFPCGSVTGAPKIAAMREIAELEASPRGAYTGSLLVAAPGHLDSSILIRTAEYGGDVVRWGTGGGITVDSDPAEEWLETVLKASPFLGAAG